MDIVDGASLGCWWTPQSKGARPRVNKTKRVVWHWTGGSFLRSAKGIYSTLKKRGLSIHYTVQGDGTVTQHADPSLTTCLHAGYVNGASIGVEVACPGYARLGALVPGATRVDNIHGRNVRVWNFRAPQMAACLELAHHLSEMYDIPMEVPKRLGELVTDTMTEAEALQFSGHMGHFHVNEHKDDPGLALLRAIDET